MPEHSKNISTGRKDAKGRIIFKGPKGGLFCRTTGGRKVAPATGAAKRKSPVKRRR